jgi:hypothetical protein
MKISYKLLFRKLLERDMGKMDLLHAADLIMKVQPIPIGYTNIFANSSI